jgi:hypothetical protein
MVTWFINSGEQIFQSAPVCSSKILCNCTHLKSEFAINRAGLVIIPDCATEERTISNTCSVLIISKPVFAAFADNGRPNNYNSLEDYLINNASYWQIWLNSQTG